MSGMTTTMLTFVHDLVTTTSTVKIIQDLLENPKSSLHIITIHITINKKYFYYKTQ